MERIVFNDLVAGVPAGLRFGGVTPGGLPSSPLVVVDLDGVSSESWSSPEVGGLVEALQLPGPVLVGVSPTPLPQAALPVIEQFACTLAPGGPGRAWAPGADDALERIAETVAASPLAAVTLNQVLRITSRLPVPDALVTESLAYSVLLAGPEHLAWRRRTTRRAVQVDTTPAVVVERVGDVLRLSLNRPSRHNAFGHAVRDALFDGLDIAAIDPGVQRVVLCGRGPSFSSGGDLDEFGTSPGVAQAHGIRVGRSVGLAVHRLRDRIEVQVQGAVAGAGVEVASFAGRVVADDAARFWLPELSLGLIPGAGGTVSLPRRIGRWRTAWMALTGTRIDVQTGLEWGLVDARQ